MKLTFVILAATLSLAAKAPTANPNQRPIRSLKPMTSKEVRKTVTNMTETAVYGSSMRGRFSYSFSENTAIISGGPGLSMSEWTVEDNRLCMVRQCKRYYKDARGRVFVADDHSSPDDVADRMVYER